MQQVVKQTIGISSKSTHKLSKKYDNHDEYLTIIIGMLKGDQDIKMKKISNIENIQVKVSKVII